MNKYCVILTSNGNLKFIESILKKDRLYDVYVIDYVSDIGFSPFRNYLDVKVYESCGGFKYFNIRDLLNDEKILNSYDYFWFPDWDLEFDFSLNEYFKFIESEKIDLSQPSLSHQSYTSWNITLQTDALYRETNFVEVMCPFFSNSALREVLWTFKLTYSSWGLDFLWSKVLNNFKIAIIDKYVIHHKKEIQSHDWVLPNGKSALLELRELLNKYELDANPRNINIIRNNS